MLFWHYSFVFELLLKILAFIAAMQLWYSLVCLKSVVDCSVEMVVNIKQTLGIRSGNGVEMVLNINWTLGVRHGNHIEVVVNINQLLGVIRTFEQFSTSPIPIILCDLSRFGLQVCIVYYGKIIFPIKSYHIYWQIFPSIVIMFSCNQFHALKMFQLNNCIYKLAFWEVRVNYSEKRTCYQQLPAIN